MWLLVFIVPLMILLDLPLFKIYFRLIFNDQEDFENSIKYIFRPDIFSLFKGEYFKDKFAEFKFSLFMVLIFITIIIEVLIVRGILIKI